MNFITLQKLDYVFFSFLKIKFNFFEVKKSIHESNISNLVITTKKKVIKFITCP